MESHGVGGMSNLFREYGSTSSIDVQGITEQSFFDMLRQFHEERPDQRSSAPVHLGELLRVPASTPSTSLPAALSPGHTGGDDRGAGRKDGAERVRKKSGGTESSLGTSSLFRKLRSASRNELDGGKGETDDGLGRNSGEAYKPWVCSKSFVHFDAQSILFDLHEAAAQRGYVAQRRNTATGASAASVSLTTSRSSAASASEPVYSSIEDLTLSPDTSSSNPCTSVDPLDRPNGALAHSPLLLCCPHFLNETGGDGERNISFLSSSAERGGDGGGDGTRGWLRKSNASLSVLEVPTEQQPFSRVERLKLFSIEHVDLGAKYYRDYFLGKGNFEIRLV